MGYMEEQDAKAQGCIEKVIIPAITELLEVFKRHRLTQGQAAIVSACALNRIPLKDAIPKVATITLSSSLNPKP